MSVRSSESLPIPLPRVLETESIRLSGAAAITLPSRWVLTAADITDPRSVADRLSVVLPATLFTPPAGPPYDAAAVAAALNALLDQLLVQKIWLSSFDPFSLELS